MFLREMVSTNLRPDIVLWSRSRMLYFIELTVPWKDLVVEAYERKKLRYVELGAEQQGWKVRLCPVEVGCREFVAKSAVSLLRESDVSGQSVRKIVKEMSEEAVRASQWI